MQDVANEGCIVQARQRTRFFELADVFLSSGLVPAYTAAAFAKRFARLALTAPPAGAQSCSDVSANQAHSNMTVYIAMRKTEW